MHKHCVSGCPLLHRAFARSLARPGRKKHANPFRQESYAEWGILESAKSSTFKTFCLAVNEGSQGATRRERTRCGCNARREPGRPQSEKRSGAEGIVYKWTKPRCKAVTTACVRSLTFKRRRMALT